MTEDVKVWEARTKSCRRVVFIVYPFFHHDAAETAWITLLIWFTARHTNCSSRRKKKNLRVILSNSVWHFSTYPIGGGNTCLIFYLQVHILKIHYHTWRSGVINLKIIVVLPTWGFGRGKCSACLIVLYILFQFFTPAKQGKNEHLVPVVCTF